MAVQPSPPILTPFTVMQWNIRGLRPNLAWLTSTLASDKVDVALLQETLLPEVHNIQFRHYDMYTSPHVRGVRQGTAILVRKNISHKLITAPIDCGEGVDVLALEIPLPTTSLTIYNLYRRPSEDVELDLGELFEFASHSPTVIAGDFNAHHPLFAANPSSNKRNVCGLHIAYYLQEFPDFRYFPR